MSPADTEWMRRIMAVRGRHVPSATERINEAVRTQVERAVLTIRSEGIVRVDDALLEDAFRQSATSSWEDSFREATAFFGGRAKALPDPILELLLRYLELSALSRARIANATTRRYLLEAMTEGLREGKDNYDIAQSIYDRWLKPPDGGSVEDGPVTRRRAETMARTEIGTAQQDANLVGARQSGMTHKKWMSVRHPRRTRRPETGSKFDHYENYDPKSGAGANGQIVSITQPFIISGEAMNYPGDPSFGASPGNRLNCLCTAAYIFKRS